ncbi:putative Transposase-associated domain-containing protein [Helianthus annuus]|nr:putative Transposase-associated domain-containing protein [Helianthus annuus]KAJ0505993.1 putative Transposase-associated domain-containing protein [Helianthus annuus]KAJ0678941.1 putative Transposase-associated domain-containing protein [Helianthus annuus]KAJ0798824.1 putative Transposase-associated domain-containing protein [Helianthus annuus]KAJ0867340.1 putative Transposase-associated domain-containing protein [Helianthus annuus]
MDNRIKRLPEFFTVDQMGFGKDSATPPTRRRITVLLNYLLKHFICLSNSSPRHAFTHRVPPLSFLVRSLRFSKVTSPFGQGNQFKDNFANSSAQDLDFAMPLGKSWTKITNKVDPVFINGAIAFAERGKTYVDSEGRIHCPCKKCVNARRHVPTVVADHIIYNCFEPSYNVWIHHGEHLPSYETDDTDSDYEESENESNDGVNELLDDVFPTGDESEAENFMDGVNLRNNPKVEKLFVDMEKPLYPGCDKFSVLGFLLELMNVKVTCKMTNVSMDMILNLFSRAFKDAQTCQKTIMRRKSIYVLLD